MILEKYVFVFKACVTAYAAVDYHYLFFVTDSRPMSAIWSLTGSRIKNSPAFKLGCSGAGREGPIMWSQPSTARLSVNYLPVPHGGCWEFLHSWYGACCSQLGCYCSCLNYNSSVHYEMFALNSSAPAAPPPLWIRHWLNYCFISRKSVIQLYASKII